jgi:hypothetical protein
MGLNQRTWVGPRWLLGGETTPFIRRLPPNEKFSSSNQYLEDLHSKKKQIYWDRLQVSKRTKVHHFTPRNSWCSPSHIRLCSEENEPPSTSSDDMGVSLGMTSPGPFQSHTWSIWSPKMETHFNHPSNCVIAGRQIVICSSGLKFSETLVELPLC